jgi:hypothetical protein
MPTCHNSRWGLTIRFKWHRHCQPHPRASSSAAPIARSAATGCHRTNQALPDLTLWRPCPRPSSTHHGRCCLPPRSALPSRCQVSLPPSSMSGWWKRIPEIQIHTAKGLDVLGGDAWRRELSRWEGAKGGTEWMSFLAWSTGLKWLHIILNFFQENQFIIIIDWDGDRTRILGAVLSFSGASHPSPAQSSKSIYFLKI